MRVLVTGASGSIGKALTSHLADKGHVVLGLDQEAEHARILRAHAKAEPHSLDYTDCRRRADVVGKAVRFGPECVVHLAALTDVYGGWNAEHWLAENVLGTMNVIEAACASGCERVIYGSSMDVHNPETWYAASKRSCESFAEVASEWFGADGMEIVGLRFSTVYGPNAPRGFIPMALKALRAGAEIPLHCWPDIGRDVPIFPLRDWTYIEDVVRAIERVIETPIGPGHGVYEIGTGESRTNKAVLAAIKGRLRLPAKVRHEPVPKGTPRFHTVDTSLFAQEYKFRCETRVEDAFYAYLEEATP